MSAPTAAEAAPLDPSQCWCCDATDDPARMVHLGNHPEVALCLGCARWAAKEAGEIEDRGRTGAGVRARDLFRAARHGVVRRGWHRSRLFGAPLHWIGRWFP